MQEHLSERLRSQAQLPRPPSVMLLSKSLSAYALDMRLLYNGAAVMCN